MCVPIAIATGGLVTGCITGSQGARWNLVMSLVPVYGVIVWNFRYDVRRRYRQLKELLKIGRKQLPGTFPNRVT
jgi:Na+/glutamate symporter